MTVASLAFIVIKLSRVVTVLSMHGLFELHVHALFDHDMHIHYFEQITNAKVHA